MSEFRYSTTGSWFKGNTHIHSTASDGGKTFSELAELYAGGGYDFLFRTDHWAASDTSADTESYPLLWIDGIELDGRDEAGSWFHVVCLGKLESMSRDIGFEAGLKSAKEQGALTILAHPHWCGNSLEEALRYGFDGVEIYNHVCHWLNGKSDGLIHWDAMLMQEPGTLGFAADDAHLRPEHPGWNGGWIVVNAEQCTADDVIAAIRRGNFYSSCGPEIHDIKLDGNRLIATTSPIRYARLVGPGAAGRRLWSGDADPLTEIKLELPEDWRYAYLEIEDMAGKRAWTNSLIH